jgi:adenosylhomocysteine nucleosidase
MIAVTFALPQESKELVHELTHSGATLFSPLPIIVGNIGRHEIAICHTGVGVDSAKRTLRELFHLQRPRALISAGFAGALDPRLDVADLLVATNFSEPNLLNVARHLCSGRGDCYFGTLTTQPHVVATSDGKLLLGQQTGASAVDMETAAIAEACRGFGLPMLAVRGISDIAAESLPVPFGVWFDPEKQSPRALALLTYLARHPSRIQPFVHFVKGIDHARHRLTEYLMELISAV